MEIDTIAAVATAPGLGGVAIVRVSGVNAHEVLRSLTPGRPGLPAVRVATLVELRDPDDGALLDRAIATVFVAPASYTGEDVVELSCHGGWVVPDLVLDACVRAGARRAGAGEFTQRAYLRGKLDLVQAEAVGDLVQARNRAFHRAALHQLERGLSKRLTGLRGGLLHLEALLAHHVDFPEEDDAPVPLEHIVVEADRLLHDLDALLRTAPEGELLREGALVVLAGRPNAGKSSLYNALIGQERAIVTDQPGTTRDALEATVQLGGFPFRLVDTAGLRDAHEVVERLGVEVARRYVDRADLLLLCVPSGQSLSEADRAFIAVEERAPLLLVRTMTDRGDPAPAPDASSGSHHEARGDADASTLGGHVRVSALLGHGLDDLRAELLRLAYGSVLRTDDDAPIVTSRRHSDGLGRARAEVSDFRDGLVTGLPAEVAASHLRGAETALEELLGVISVDDVLDVVFREFCVGK